jgi:hypothetical protein
MGTNGASWELNPPRDRLANGIPSDPNIWTDLGELFNRESDRQANCKFQATWRRDGRPILAVHPNDID